MASVKISDLTNQASILSTDLIEIETSGGLSRKTTLTAITDRIDTAEADIVNIQSSLGTAYYTSANYTITDDDGYGTILVDTTSGDITITLPLKANNIDRKIKILKAGGASNKIIVSPNATDANTLTSDALAAIWLPVTGDFIELLENQSSGYWISTGERVTSTLWYDTHSGYGSTDTRVLTFTNNSVALGNYMTSNFGSYGTAGLEITIKRTGNYCFLAQTQNAYYFGIMRNATEKTSNIQSTTLPAQRLSWHTIATAGYLGTTTSGVVKLTAGDIICLQGTTGTTPSSSNTVFRCEYVS